MSALLAVVLAAAGVATQVPPAPARPWDVLWQRQLVPPGLLEWKPREGGGAAVDPAGGAVVVGTRDGWLHALDADGNRLWDLQASGRFEAPPRIEADAIYVGSSDGWLYALELGTGKLRWKYQANEEVGTTPAVSGDLVLVMTLQDTLVAVDAKTGAWRWHHRREPRETFTVRGAAPVIVADGLAVGAYSDGTVAVLEAATGTVKWERRVAPTADIMDVDGLRVDGTRLYAAAYSGAVYALELATGKQLWELKTPGACRVATGGGNLVAVTTTQVLGLSPRDGQTRWTLPLDGTPAGEPVFVGSRVLVPAGKGLLWIDASTGQLLHVFDPGTGVSATPGARLGRAYVLSNAGDLVALDVR